MPDSRFEVRFTVLEPMRGDPGPEVVVATSDYDIWAYVNAPDGKQQCAEPVGIAVDQPPSGPIELRISHNVGNCAQFKKPRPAQ